MLDGEVSRLHFKDHPDGARWVRSLHYIEDEASPDQIPQVAAAVRAVTKDFTVNIRRPTMSAVNGHINFMWSFADTRQVAILRITESAAFEWFIRNYDTEECEEDDDDDSYKVPQAFIDFVNQYFKAVE